MVVILKSEIANGQLLPDVGRAPGALLKIMEEAANHISGEKRSRILEDIANAYSMLNEAYGGCLTQEDLASFLDLLSQLPIRLRDGVPFPIHTAGVFSTCMNKLSYEVFVNTKKNIPIINLGGDHCIAMASISGALRAHSDLRVIWVDAHGDFNTPATSPSGNLHGMPLAALQGAFSAPADWKNWMVQALKPHKVLHVGGRDFDREEKREFDRSGITSFSAERISENHALVSDWLDKGRGPVWVSFDIDSLDPAIAPGTGVTSPGGLSLNVAQEIIRVGCSSKDFVGIDLVEFNPSMDQDEKTAKTLLALFETLFRALYS